MKLSSFAYSASTLVSPNSSPNSVPVAIFSRTKTPVSVPSASQLPFWLPVPKSFGPVVLDCSVYIKQVLQEHLTNTDTYRILTQAKADSEFESFDDDMSDFLTDQSWYLPSQKSNI
jgi:hypothetical protein